MANRKGYRARAPHRPKPRPHFHFEGTSHQAETPAGTVPTTPLFLKLCEREALYTAFREIRKGRTESARRWTGAADRVSLELFERNLDQNLTRLRSWLLSGRYQPDPIVNFYLPKPGGGHRLLAVLTVRDRVAQRAALALISPLFEPEFLDCSYGFRPDRSTKSALDEVEKAYREGYRWAVDTDIEAFFDNIDRARLVRLLRGKISDPRLIYLLKLWLNNVKQLEREVVKEEEMPAKNTPTSPALAKAAEVSFGDKLGELTRLAVENGLDWGISTLGGTSSRAYGYSSNYRGGYSSARYDRFRDDEEEGWRPEPEGPGFAGEALKRVGIDGALAGLWLAKGFIRKGGALPGVLGMTARAGAALGAIGAAGFAAHRVWHQSRNNQKNKQNQPDTGAEGLQIPAWRRGIAQGSILSPLYSNIYLHEFDLRLTEKGYRLVRFADDLVILCRTSREAEEALDFAEQVLGSLGLVFKPSKTGLKPLEKGFKFLGAEWGPDGKWLLKDDGNPRNMPVKEWVKRTGVGWLKRKAQTGVVQKGRKDHSEKIEIVIEEEED